MILEQYSEPKNNINLIDKNEPFLFQLIVEDLILQGYSILPSALPPDLLNTLSCYQQNLTPHKYADAGIGRQEDYTKVKSIRSDEISWITNDFNAGALWLDWIAKLQSFLNQRLFLGLSTFESHFAHYSPGSFYKRHYDAFRGKVNRVLTVVVYLNPQWDNNDRGEFVLYHDEQDYDGIKVTPNYGTMVVFLSEDFPHEVLPSTKDSFSIAGWFRVNTSQLT